MMPRTSAQTIEAVRRELSLMSAERDSEVPVDYERFASQIYRAVKKRAPHLEKKVLEEFGLVLDEWASERNMAQARLGEAIRANAWGFHEYVNS